MPQEYQSHHYNATFVQGMRVHSRPAGDDPDGKVLVYYPASPREDIHPRVSAYEYCFRSGIPVHERAALLMIQQIAGDGDGFGLDAGETGYEFVDDLLRDEYPDIDSAAIARRHFGDVLGIKLFFWLPVSCVPERTRSRRGPNRKPISTTRALKVFARDDYRCLHCGTRDDLTVDHIHPVSKGGTNDLDNLQTLCKSCNSRKGARV